MAVICIFKLKNEKYFVFRMEAENLKKINNFFFENDKHELNEFLSEDILKSDWIRENPIIRIDSIEYSPNESDEQEFAERLIITHGNENVRTFNSLNLG